MVRKGDRQQVETRERMRGGAGQVQICHLEQERLPEKGRLFARMTLAPGCSIGSHTHEGETELFYFMEGEGVAIDDGERIPVKAGDSMTTGSGHSHGVENTGATEMVILAAIIKD